ncbi:5-bromo-4-chloroindolyl phosphate hydrolysis family protein [Labrys wisconsinensis]|uniref:5-bromo-4-chloroindolyl phosphate hydrolysis protein n=1 Tax=Labrys wisconsinensis TaxID=425677 RepID=A0ABU0J263_9HYPH|nr:5-bromo-4-chloroindolyl phosphate hydrolysis family protein [Labrys wisconsinensis]MDQ0468341.1 hypothetical protein [Labrys wisconsinensis]
MAGGSGNGLNHVLGGVVAAVAVPAAVFGLNLPFLVALPLAAGLYLGTAFLFAPRRAADRIDPARVGRAQAELVGGLIEDGEALVARLREASRRLRSQRAAGIAAHMAEIAHGILERLAAEPGKLSAVRRFLGYYLPRSAEIAEGMVVVEGQRTTDARRLAEIEDVMVRLDHAFTFYADSFAQAELDALDVELRLLSRSLAEDIGPAPHSKGAS